MKTYNICNEELNIKDIKKISKESYFRKVEKEFFTHDEDIYHINSIVSLKINYIDFDNKKQKKNLIFHKEYIKENLGWEIDFDIYDFIECVDETNEFKESKIKLKKFIEILEKDFNNKYDF